MVLWFELSIGYLFTLRLTQLLRQLQDRLKWGASPYSTSKEDLLGPWHMRYIHQHLLTTAARHPASRGGKLVLSRDVNPVLKRTHNPIRKPKRSNMVIQTKFFVYNVTSKSFNMEARFVRRLHVKLTRKVNVMRSVSPDKTDRETFIGKCISKRHIA